MSYCYYPWRYRKSFRWYRGYLSSIKKNDLRMNPVKFRQTEKIYHYTSLSSGNLILLSQVMRMSKQSTMNDINESSRPLFADNPEELKTEYEKYFQNSFTLDDDKIPGFAIPAMWGHYADKGYGMCLVFDKMELCKRLNNCGFYHSKIEYFSNFDPEIIVLDYVKDYKEYLKDNIDEVFFKKSFDWQYEREYRVLGRFDEGSPVIDIRGCIISAVVCNFKDIGSDDNACTSSIYKFQVDNIMKKIEIPLLVLSRWDKGYKLDCYEDDPGGEQWYPAPISIQDIDVV